MENEIDNVIQYIDNAYALLVQNAGITVREQQVALSREVASAFLSGRPLAAEAPTGTGKTLAYLVGALAARKAMSCELAEPILISTATKALQQQLTSTDLPLLAKAGLLSLSSVVLAKGKANFLCLKIAEETKELLNAAAIDPEIFVDDAAHKVPPGATDELLEAFRSGRWNGDFDFYEGSNPLENLRMLRVNSETCNRKKCAHFRSCAYFKAREELGKAEVIVANHDLTLLDLKHTSMGQEPVLPLQNYCVVFDEAHHLPEKAIKQGMSEAPLSKLRDSLSKLLGMQKLISKSPELEKLLSVKSVRPEQFGQDPVSVPLQGLTDILDMLDVDTDTFQRRFSGGVLPAPLAAALTVLRPPLNELVKNLKLLVTTLVDVEGSLSRPLAEKGRELVRRALDVQAPASECVECFDALLDSKRRTAKWLFSKGGQVSLHCAPLEGADVLKPLLWKNPRVRSAALVSATLRDIGGFSRFANKAGLPENTRYKVLPYTFPYEESVLTVAAMKNTPKLAERKEFIKELESKLPGAINEDEATLVIFPSWSMLREFTPLLRERFGMRVQVQGDKPVRVLLRDHREAIDQGKGNILAGVATLSEGLDLPGNYCSHVVVVALPFAVPNDPVEQEIAAILGNKYFSERSLPDAMVRLTQIVGRLLRRETDRGRITVFDRRLASTSYGRQILSNLPPFRKVVAPLVA